MSIYNVLSPNEVLSEGLTIDYKKTLKIAGYGDSITTNCNTNSIVSSATVSAGVLTVTVSASGNAFPGLNFYLMNVTPDIYVARYTCTTGSSGNTYVANTSLPDGTITYDSNSYVICTDRQGTCDFIGYCCALSSGGFRRGNAIGFSGKNSDYIATKTNMISRSDGDIICEFSGINDINGGGLSAETVFTRRLGIWQDLKGKGFRVVCFTLGPVDRNRTPANDTKRIQLLRHNRMVYEFCRDNPEYIYFNQFFVNADPLSSTCDFKSGYGNDGAGVSIHMNARGAYNVGKSLYESLIRAFPVEKRTIGATSSQDRYDASNTITQIYFDPLFSLAGSAINQNNNTGTIPNNMVFGGNIGSPTSVVHSLVARDDGRGYNWRIVLTTSGSGTGGNGEGVSFVSNGNSLVSGRIPSGKKLRGTVDIMHISGDAPRNISFSLSLNSAGGVNGDLTPISNVGIGGYNLWDGTTKTLQYEYGGDFISQSNVNFLFVLDFRLPNASVVVETATIEIGNISLWVE